MASVCNARRLRGRNSPAEFLPLAAGAGCARTCKNENLLIVAAAAATALAAFATFAALWHTSALPLTGHAAAITVISAVTPHPVLAFALRAAPHPLVATVAAMFAFHSAPALAFEITPAINTDAPSDNDAGFDHAGTAIDRSTEADSRQHPDDRGALPDAAAQGVTHETRLFYVLVKNGWGEVGGRQRECRTGKHSSPGESRQC